MKKLGIEGLGAVWIKIFSLIQLVTGNVDVKNKGDLQTQINRLDQKIPSAANNGKLTIQKNGADIQSFTANQSGDATANIIVPNTTRSAAVTQEGQLALDAIEKNAAVPGTLAYDLAQTNSKLNTIPSISFYGESLDDFWQEGKTLYCWVDTLTQEGINRSNTPAAGSFMVTSMAVYGSTRTVQIAVQVYHGYGAGDAYVRSKHDASWSSWQKLVTDSRLPAINGVPLTFIEENVSDYGTSHRTINGITYGKLCLINYMFGVKDGMSPWEIRYIATGAPVPAWIGITYWGNPVIAGGKCDGCVSVEVDGEGRLLIHAQEHALSNNNWLIGTMVYLTA